MAKQKTILVVDDEENVRFLIQKELEDEGYNIMTADSGERALEMLDNELPDLITLDMRMDPGIGGIEALRKIKEKNKDIPVVICSGFPDYKEDFGSWASEAYVVKTGDMGLEELKSKIEELIGK